MQATDVVVYSQSAHITQTKTLSAEDIKAGKWSTLVPSSISSDSVIAFDDKGRVLQIALEYPLTLAQRINGPQKPVGQVLVAKQDLTKRLQGKLLSMDTSSNSVTMQLDQSSDVATILNPAAIFLINNNTDVETRPKVTLTPFPDSASVAWSFVASGISWQPYGTLVVNTSGEKALLRIAAEVTNDTDIEIAGNLTLVAGDVNQPSQGAGSQRKSQVLMAMPAAAAPMARKATINTSGYSDVKDGGMQPLDDLQSYAVGQRTIDRNTFLELSSDATILAKIYTCTCNEYSPKPSVAYGYEFNAPRFLPNCNLQVYKNNEGSKQIPLSGILGKFLGQGSVQETQKMEKVKLFLGTTSTIMVISTFEQTSGEKNYNYVGKSTWRFSSRMRNLNDSRALLYLKLQQPSTSRQQTFKGIVGNDALANSVVQEDGMFVWQIKLEPKQTLDFTVELEYQSLKE